ncbi:pentapeptide repeat-containing protein [Haloarcula amylolytica]|uniref:pentapeptide repeat-containing protein n=1 Tax=Haloarcula amylolytica TaxID=396317 RepID=UPI001375B1F1|nr:pentapeptide repeat-containing protein [Haloarcula amylolytica]
MSGEQDSICGYSADASDLPNGVKPRSCSRDVWKDGDCVWHAEETNKPIAELKKSADAGKKRVDDAYLRQAELQNRIDFKSFTLYNPDFQESNIDSADFRAAIIHNGDFSQASLEGSKFDSERLRKTVSDTKMVDTCFCDSKIKGANFSESVLSEVCFDEATGSSVKFNRADVSGGSFREAELHDVEFEAANIRRTCFEKADVFNGDFNRSFAKGADFSGSDLRQAEFNWARTENMDLRGSIVDKDTDFDWVSVYEFASDRFHEGQNEIDFDIFTSPPSEVTIEESLGVKPEDYTVKEYLSTINHTDKGKNSLSRFRSRISHRGSDKTSEHLRTAVGWYRDLQRVYDNSLVTEHKRWFAIREKEVERKIQFGRKTLSWLRLAFHRLTMRHGESPGRVLAVAGLTIVLFALAYGLTGVRDLESGQVLKYRLSGEWTWGMLSPFQLSISRFLTPSNVYYAPIDSVAGLALFESIIGALLVAMFVFTLGRRATE